MYPQGGRSGSGHSGPFHHQQQQPGRGRAAGHGSTGQPVPQHDDEEVPLEALEAGVSPIGGVYYAATPTPLRVPDQSQQQQPTPPSPSSGSPTGGRRPSPSRVGKPVFGVKGAYRSMAARRYAAALAASGHADPDVLADAIQAAAAEAEGSCASQLAPAAAAATGAGGAGTSRATGAPLRGFGSGPIMLPSSTAAAGSSSAAGAMLGQSRQVASLVSPRLVGSATGKLITQHHQQETAPLGAPSDASYGLRASFGQEMSSKTPAAASGSQGSALSPLGSSSTERPAAAAGAPQVSQQEQAAQVQGVPVAQGVMGTQMRARGSGPGQETEIRTEAHPPQQQQQQQQQQAPVPLAATQGFQSFRINPSVTSSMSADASRSPSPPYRGRGALPSAVTAAAAAAAAAVAAGGIAERSGRRSPGRLSPARSASPARPSGVASSPQGRHSQGPTLITLEGPTGSVTGSTDASGSLLAAQQRLQEPPQAATIPTSALAGASAAFGGGLTVAAGAAAAAGSSSRPVDLASGQNSSTSSSPLSQKWARPPAITPGAQQPDTGASGKSTPFMTPMGSRSSSFGPQSDSQERHRLAETTTQEQTEQQQQQSVLQQQGSQGSLLGSLWARFSRSTSKGEDASRTGSAGGAATSSPVPQQQQQQQRPAGWTTAAGAGAAAAAAAAAAGAYAASGRQGAGDTAGSSSGHYSLDPVTGLVSSSSPSRGPGLRPEGDQVVASLGGSMAGSPGHQSLQITPTYLEPLDEMGRPAGAAYSAGGQSSLPGGMGHGTPPGGHAVFAPGAVHGPGSTAAYSYSPAVGGPGSANGSGSSALGFVDPYTGAAAAAGGGMLAAGAGAAAAAAGGIVAPASPGTIPAAIPGRFRQIAVPDSDVSSMMSYASSAGEPLQPQRLPPATWPAEALPSPTGSGSNQSAHHFAAEGFAGSYDPQQQQGDIVSGAHPHPTAQPSRPELESSDGGAGGAGTAAAAAAAAAAGVAALAAGAAASSDLAGSKRGQQQAGEDQPQVRIKLDAAAPASASCSGSPRRRSRVGKGTAAAAAGQEVTEQQQVDEEQARKSTGGARRKSGLGGLFGVSTYEAKRSKGGKQSLAPGAKDPTPPADAAAAADTATTKERKRASAAGTSRHRSKKQRAMCIVIPLVILAILGGIGAAIGITMGQQRSAVASRSRAAPAPAAAGAPAAPVTLQPLSFKVNVTLPPDPSGGPAPSCSELFSPKADRGKLEEYLFTFRQAYASALNLQPADIKVGSLACDGRPVKTPSPSPQPPPAAAAGAGPTRAPAAPPPAPPAGGGPAAAAAPTPTFTPTFAAPPPTEARPNEQMAPVTWAPAATTPSPARRRSLLEAQRAKGAKQVARAAKPAVLTTDFTVPAPTDATERTDLAATVMELSPSILETPMTQFFGRPVKVAPAVEQPPQPPAKAAAPAPVPPAAPRPPAKAPVRSPAPPKKKPPQASPSPAPAKAPPVRPPRPPAVETVPEETPVEAPPMPLVLPPKASPAAPAPAIPSFGQKPTGAQAPRPSPRPVPAAVNRPSPVPTPTMAPSPPPQGSWPSLLPIFRPQQPQPQVSPRPRWPFGRPPVPQPQPPATTASSSPEEATPVLVISAQPPAPPPGGYPAPPLSTGTFSWPAAPSCHGKPNGHNATPDAEGRLWGFQQGRSCAFRTPNDQPITINWDNAVSCTNKPTTSNSVFDGENRLWGFQNSKSCAYRGNAVQSPPAPGQVVITWEAAPSCAGAPDARNSVRNPQGQLWGYENGKSCGYRIQNGAAKVTWVSAPVCKFKPNHFTAVRDDLGRLWGWEDNTSCRFTAAS